MSSTRSRSSSRSRTMIGYSLPPSRKNAACVPPTLVRMRVGDAGHRQAEQRRLRAIDLHRELRAAVVAADARVAHFRHPVHDALRVDLRERCALCEIVAADLERDAAVAAAAAGGSSAGCRRRRGSVMIDAGDDAGAAAGSGRGRSARSSAVRSSFGTSAHASRCVRLAPPPPPKPPPPPACVMIVFGFRHVFLGSSDSSRAATSCARSMRVPTGSSAVTATSPSSACGISSKPMVGRMSDRGDRPAPCRPPRTVGR